MARFEFNPDRVACYEAAGWRAYYRHDWFRFLRTIVALCHEQFRIPFSQSWMAAYVITRAAAMWVAPDHDRERVLRLHERFYTIARRYSRLGFTPSRVAELEEQYWDVHRRLAGLPDKTEFVNTMIELHSALFGITPEEARESAVMRVEANNTVDLITSGQSRDPEADWSKLEALLRRCYHSIYEAVNGEPAPTSVASAHLHHIL